MNEPQARPPCVSRQLRAVALPAARVVRLHVSAFCPASVRIPLVELLGMTLHHMAQGESEMRYEAQEEHLNSFGVTHGGALMTLLDVTMATAARSETPQLGVVTVEMKTSFMRPASGPLRALGKVVHRTPTMAFTEARVFDAQGQVCSHATGTFKYVRRLPGTGRALHGLQRSSAPHEEPILPGSGT